MFSLKQLLSERLFVSEWREGIRQIQKSEYRLVAQDEDTYSCYVEVGKNFWIFLCFDHFVTDWFIQHVISFSEDRPYKTVNVNPRNYEDPLEAINHILEDPSVVKNPESKENGFVELDSKVRKFR